MPFLKLLLVTTSFLLLALFQPTTVQAASGVPILMYHYIGNNPNPADTARNVLSVAPDKFDAQMSYLTQQGYTPITLDDLYGVYNLQRSMPAKPIILTFDDGYVDFYYNAYPILRKYNFHAVSFIPTGLINQGYYMTWAQVKEIQSSHLVTFEDHSITHPNLVSLSADKITSELRDSRTILQQQTGYPVNFVAYPFGATSVQVQSIAKNLGYVGGLGTWNGKVFGPSMNMPRIRITGSMTIKEFASRL